MSSLTSVSALLSSRFLQQLVRLAHLLEDQFFTGELQGEAQPRCVFGLEPSKRLGEAKHPLLELVHLGRDVLLAEADRVAIRRGRGLGRGRLLLVIEDGVGLVRLLRAPEPSPATEERQPS